MGCLKLTYYEKPDFRVIYFKNELTLKSSSEKVRRSYVFGFQGQEGDDEVYGTGNSYTAEFWQYDSRLGRRWNVDPVDKPWESSYAAFANNPIWFVDLEGADTLDIMKNDEGKWSVSNVQTVKGDDVFRVKVGDETKTYTFSEGEYGKRINVLNLESNDHYTLGIYHISGKDEEAAIGYIVTPGGEPSTTKDSGKRLPDDVYTLKRTFGHNAKWIQPLIYSGEKTGYVGGRGVKIHPTPSKLPFTEVAQWTEGCYVVCTDYLMKNGKIMYNSKLSIATSKQINTILGATQHYESVGFMNRPGSDFDNGINFKLIQKSAF